VPTEPAAVPTEPAAGTAPAVADMQQYSDEDFYDAPAAAPAASAVDGAAVDTHACSARLLAEIERGQSSPVAAQAVKREPKAVALCEASGARLTQRGVPSL
jgi:hypothetical protein